MKILLTAFEPFGGESINPALEAVNRIKDEIRGAKIAKVEVPTSFARSFQVVKQAIDLETPDVVLMIGQAGGRDAITPERRAINLDLAKLPDNDGYIASGNKIVETAPEEYLSTLPIEKIVDAINASGVPAEISDDAGTFVCNHLFFSVLDYLAKRGTPAGFIHVPYETRQTAKKQGVFALPIEDIVKGITAIVAAVVEN
ncbi:MAG: pyroglutamyl-peptidase I [Clostridia bacterium]|nr:pyroglutamyl-peptidase I [Clostridia bacterium]